MDILKQLPPSPAGKIGFPWTKETPPQYSVENLPKISIITPSFNQGKFIEETIRSVLLQGYPNLEYIIIDGGSTDETLEIIKKYSDFITYWVSKPDEGQSHAINEGLAKATGDIFNWINSDDLLAPNALWKIASCFLGNTNIDVLIGKLKVIKHDELLVDSYRMQYFEDVESTMNFGGMSQPSLFFRLEKIKLLIGVDERFHYCMDLDLWYRYLLTFGLKHIASTEQTLAYYRVHDATKSSNEKEANAERLVLILTLLRALGMSEQNINKLKPQTLDLKKYNKVWDLNAPFLNKNKLYAYLLEQILVSPHFDFSLFTSFKLWIISFKFYSKGRRQYFFTLPLRAIYRKFKKYRKAYK